MTLQIDRIVLIEGNSETVMLKMVGDEAQAFFAKYLEAKGSETMERALDEGQCEMTYHNGELTLAIYI